MKFQNICWAVTMFALPLLAQQANPAPGCSATPAQLEANKKVALAFFSSTGADRVALADPTYKQHNPAFIKGGREAGGDQSAAPSPAAQ